MKYKVADLQINGRYFNDGHIFDGIEEVADHLIDYHSVDFSGADENDNELEIEEYLKHYGIITPEQRLNWVLEYGQWELEEVPDYDKIRDIIDNFIIYVTSNDEYREELREALDMYLEEGEPFF